MGEASREFAYTVLAAVASLLAETDDPSRTSELLRIQRIFRRRVGEEDGETAECRAS